MRARGNYLLAASRSCRHLRGGGDGTAGFWEGTSDETQRGGILVTFQYLKGKIGTPVAKKSAEKRSCRILDRAAERGESENNKTERMKEKKRMCNRKPGRGPKHRH